MMEKQSRERGTLDGPKSRITALCSMVSWHISHAHRPHQHPAPPTKKERKNSMCQFNSAYFQSKRLVCESLSFLWGKERVEFGQTSMSCHQYCLSLTASHRRCVSLKRCRAHDNDMQLCNPYQLHSSRFNRVCTEPCM